MKHVVLYVGHMYKPFWTKKIWPGWQGGSGKVKIWPRMGLAYVHFWLWSPLETPKWVKDPRNGLKSIRGSWGDHLRSISGVFHTTFMYFSINSKNIWHFDRQKLTVLLQQKSAIPHLIAIKNMIFDHKILDSNRCFLKTGIISNFLIQHLLRNDLHWNI